MNLEGRTLGQYRILAPIGQGGMAYVYKAYQPALDRFVAIKVLPSTHAVASGFSKRFEREARAVAQLNHPNILPIIDFGQEDEFSYIITKLVSGGTLQSQLDQAISLTKTAKVIEQVGAALDHAHERGILHRDVKPSNILLDDGDWVQLADFGLAKILAGEEGLTVSGVGIGTPSYMSPEQGQGLQVSHHTDIYSLGIILYQMVTGRLPFEAETPMGIIFKHIYEPPTLPRLVKSSIPRAVEAVTIKAIEKRPQNRYRSAGALAQALRAAVEASEGDEEVISKPSTPPPDSDSRQPTLTLGKAAIKRSLRSPERTPLAELTPPPEPPCPPEVKTFIGREAELTDLGEKLETSHLVVITGMAGVGKTTLATQLVQRTAAPGKTFWHTFHENEGVEAIIWKLAGFLFWRGQEDLWHMLQSAQEIGSSPPPTEVLLDYVFQMLRGQGYSLFLEDWHLVENDPLLAQLVERLYRAIKSEQLSLVITSRRRPQHVGHTAFEPLSGLNADDARTLLTAQGLSLPDELASDLYTQTEGNAQLLMLASEALKGTQDPEGVIAHLAETDEIGQYLMAEVDAALTHQERRVMSAVSVLLGHLGTRDVIESILGGDGVGRVLTDLKRRHLLNVSFGEGAKSYSQHATVRAFYYDLLGRRERREMHRRAGDHYAGEHLDRLKAALHYERAGEYERAAQLATDDVWRFINQGQARALRRLLERFTDRQLDTIQWTTVNYARGEIYALLGEKQQAQESYQAALSGLEDLSDSTAVRELKAQVCRGMGAVLEYESPQDALVWLRRGLDELPEECRLLEADLHLKVGSALIAVGDYAAALSAVEEGLDRLPQGPSWVRAGALINLGHIHSSQGDLEQGQAYTRQGLEVSRQVHNRFKELVALSNLGIDKEISGDWEGAAADYRQALALAERLGSVAEQARIESLLGHLLTNQGDHASALTHLEHSAELARDHDLLEHLSCIQSALADLHLRQGNSDAPQPLLDEAEKLAQELGTQYQLPEIYRGRALMQLLKEQPETALAHAERSVELARDLGASWEQGNSLRTLGQVLLAGDQSETALTAFEDSLSLLADQDPYEAARTKMAWGGCLASNGEPARGLALLQEAQTTFQELGAQRDWAAVDEIIRRENPGS